MKKIITILSCFVGMSGNGQVIHSISVGPVFGVGANFGKSSNLSVGGSIEYIARFSSAVGIRLSGGYNRFNGKYFDDYVSFLAGRAGLHVFVYQDLLFVFAEAGIATYKSSNPDPALTRFSWAAGAGYYLYLGEKKHSLQMSAFFNYFRHNPNLTYTWIDIRAAYCFSWGDKKKQKNQ